MMNCLNCCVNQCSAVFNKYDDKENKISTLPSSWGFWQSVPSGGKCYIFHRINYFFREPCQVLAVLLVIFIFIVVYLLLLSLNWVINNSAMLLWHSNNVIFYAPCPLASQHKTYKFTIRTFLSYLIYNQILGNTPLNTN